MTRTPSNPTDAPAAPARAARRAPAGLAWVALACALVLGSGAYRWGQVRRVEASMTLGRESPFPLDELPLELGDWNGTKSEIDPRIVAGTGSKDLITRRYVNHATGVTLDVIVLYGPAGDVFIHTPELCYPKAGFFATSEASDRSIRCPEESVPFRSISYAKGDAGQVDNQEVYFSWRFGGRWSTRGHQHKELERIPGMYKVQVARRLAPNESRSLDNPCEAFLVELIPALDARIKGAPVAGLAEPPNIPRDTTPPEGHPR